MNPVSDLNRVMSSKEVRESAFVPFHLMHREAHHVTLQSIPSATYHSFIQTSSFSSFSAFIAFAHISFCILLAALLLLPTP